MTIVDRRYSVAEGTAVKAPCLVATTANITLSGLQSIDGVTVVENDRVLVKSQSTGADNGIYSASSGNWLRTRDFDGAYDIVQGTRVFVTAGSTLAGNEYYVSTANPITVGSTSITFTQMPAAGIAANAAAAVAAAAAAEAAEASATASAALLGNVVHQYDTRALAIAATVPVGVNFIRTLAHDSSYIENSGSLFKRVVAGTAFLDTWPLTGTIVGGSGYADDTYYGVPLGGGDGIGIFAKITVSGGAVTAVDHSACPGNAYKVGNVLTASNAYLGGAGSGFTYTVATISTPTASFVNTVDSSRWQYLVSRNAPHANEFGAKPDRDGAASDAAATNSFTPIQNALFFAGRHGGTNSDNGGYAGDRVMLGVGTYLLNSSPAASLIVPFGVYLEGVGGSTLKFADAFNANTHCITLGDPNSHLACFRAGLRNLTAFFSRGIGASLNIFMVYSNNTQDGGGLDNVYLYCGQRGGFKYEVGYGGASTLGMDTVSVNWEGINPGLQMNIGTTIVNTKDLILGCPSSGTNNSVNGVELSGSGGMYKFDGFHGEGMPNGFSVNLTGNSMVKLINCTGGNALDQLVTLAAGNTPGNLSMEMCAKNGSTILVLNGQPTGTSRTPDVTPADGIVSFNP